MTDNSSNKALYTLAINAVCDDMKSRRFSIRTETPSDETVVFFENSNGKYGIVLPKQSDSNNLTADGPFELTHFKGKNLNSREKFVMPLNVKDEDGIKRVAKKWLDALLPKPE